MPNQQVGRGLTATLGRGVVKTTLTLTGVAADYSITLGVGAPANYIGFTGGTVYAVNGQAVSVTNNSPGHGADNLTLAW